jgi:hypothetical protein
MRHVCGVWKDAFAVGARLAREPLDAVYLKNPESGLN